jgi:cobalt-zinc-cadmium efflux system protein
MGHDHHHHHTPSSVNRAFIIGIVLNIIFVLIEVFYGFYHHSLALLSDAGHNFSDVISLSLALIGFHLSKVKASQTYTYGYQKTTIVVALINTLLLLVAIGGISIEATNRLIEGPTEVEGKVIALVAGIGIIINAGSALLFFRDKDHDINIKGAYLHLALDALVSAGVVVSGLLIRYTHYYWIDSITSYIIAIVIFFSTWNLLKDSLRLSLDGVPKGIDLAKVKEMVLKTPGVKDIHHIHIWAMSTTQNALTAHVVVLNDSDAKKLKEQLKHELLHLNISHATLELESENEVCQDHSDC